MYAAGRSSWLAVAVVSATIGFNVTVARGQVNCGDIIITKTAMTVDLVCATDPGFTVDTGGSVDMAGHQLSACAGCDGIALNGQGAKLSNGSIVGSGLSVGVNLGGSGVHKVENITVIGTSDGFASSSDKNKLKNCAAYVGALGGSIGFNMLGSKNAISRSHSSGAYANFRLGGDNNNLTENTSVNAAAVSIAGILVTGNANKLSRNTSSNNDGTLGAIQIIGSENKLSSNTVTDSDVTGLYVQGNDNKISKTVATNSAIRGINLIGNFNKLSKNTATDNAAHGIAVAGSGNNINASNANNNGAAGIVLISGDANSLKSNVTMRNAVAEGVYVNNGATNSSISKTVALANAIDLRDDNMNCGTNVWAKSVFRTSEAGGVGGHACIQ